MRDNAGRIIGAVEVFSDINDKKNIERRAENWRISHFAML
jgi:hypothetical protein